MGIKKVLSTVKNTVGDFMANLGDLNDSQLQELERKKKELLSVTDDAMDPAKAAKLVANRLTAIQSEVFRAYLPQLQQLYVPVAGVDGICADESRVLSFDVTRWVTDANENSIEKLSNVYQVLHGEKCNVALIFNRTKDKCRVTLAVSSENESFDPTIVRGYGARLRSAIAGNFPGSNCSATDTIGRIVFPYEGKVSVSAVSNLATEKSEKFISQSIEKLLDGLVPKQEDENYTLVLLARPVNDTAPYINALHEQYSAISPFAQLQKQFSITESATAMSSSNFSGGASYIVSANVGKAWSTTSQVGNSQGNTVTYTNYSVKHTLDLIEGQMKRIEQCQALGMWNFAAYVISPNYAMTQNVAHMYVSLTQGEQSYLEPVAVNVWNKTDQADTVAYIMNALQSLHHPIFKLDPNVEERFLMYPTLVDPTTMLSGSELAHALNFPQKSVSGFPVIQCAAFGRNVLLRNNNDEGNVNLGCVYHMQKEEPSVRVKLNAKSLTAHTFITGSTGSGKSNTVYKLLDELCFENEPKAKFLVIEPAKGEYKQVFGGYEGVSVYGTNFRMGPLLKLNPFSFPDEIHVLEHIDRLIEIFNACWPMYAAMPAVLKDAIEASYESCGWSLTYSVCEPKKYPTFATLLEKLPEIMSRSDYSKDTKGDYIGALVTRIKSLTNGINGQIFCSDEGLADEQLFDQNVIVDLSRVGSMETKSLLMGILMIKLQEHRMAKASDTDSGLRHVTVLEEAHNLLRRTSSEQSQDSSNLQGKSVEMLANAIAEMRTYGEGFIIADQAPGLLDMAVIRNTNTKIIMRLPDESDRILVGKAAGLTDEQIVELSKLDCGVAAVFQNHWLEAVLCKVDEFKKEQKKPLAYQAKMEQMRMEGSTAMNAFLAKLLGKPTEKELSEEEVDKIRSWIDKLGVDRNTRTLLVSVLEGVGQVPANLKGELMYRLVNGNDFLKYARTVSDREAGIRWFEQRIMEMLQISAILAEEVRKEVFQFAADRIQTDPQHMELMYYGGLL